MSLQTIIDEQNFINELFGKPTMGVPTTMEQLNDLVDVVECQLSPENLTCDGEMPMQAVRRKAKQLNKALDELEQIRYQLADTSVTALKKTKLTKKALAMQIYEAENGIRKNVIPRLRGELMMSAAGAATYYYNCKKGV